jgi:colicin import membrane protein
MFDREVSERDGGFRLNGMIIISLLFHVAVLTLLFFSPSFPSPKLTFGPVYTVSLVNFSGKAVERRGASASAKELLATDRRETVLKKQMEPAKSIPIRSLETRKKKDPDLEKAMADIRKKASATADTVKRPQAKTAPEKTAPEKTAGSGSQSGDGEMNTQMHAYYALIWSRIKGGWALPQGLMPGEVLEAVIDVTILRSGAVTDVNFEKRSGNRYFDESAMKAIRKASPFPPLPMVIGESSIQVGIRFHSSELKS